MLFYYDAKPPPQRWNTGEERDGKIPILKVSTAQTQCYILTV